MNRSSSRRSRAGFGGGVVAVVGVVAATIGVALPAGAVGGTAGPDEFVYGTGECPPVDSAERGDPVRAFDDAPQLCIEPTVGYEATFVTSEGDIVVDLDTANTPGTVNNFVTLARWGYYDDTPIFRAEPLSGLFQGGGADNTSSPGYTIPDEGDGYSYPPGTLAMARTAEPDSAGAQWFFTTDENAEYLERYGTYVVFGAIVDGLDIAQAITASGDAQGVPTREIVLSTVTVTELADGG